jgi:indole-3-glycerol phosphate synthase
MDVLKEITETKRAEVAKQKRETPFAYLQRFYCLTGHQTLSFKQALLDSPTGIIAEFKRKSPSKGWLSPDAVAKETVKSYAEAGATAVSVLTDREFFGGGFFDFKKARKAVDGIPFLRKDFIVDEYQVHQSKVLGADVILLIAACLTKKEVARFAAVAHELELEVLLEVHGERELDYLTEDVDVVGVNNRDLKRFVTDIGVSLQLAERIPPEWVKISESGLSNVQDVNRLRQAGYRGFLMGEHFMKTPNPGKALVDFMEGIER